MSGHRVFLGRSAALIVVAALAACAGRDVPLPPARSADPAPQKLPAISYEAHVPAAGIAASAGELHNPYVGDASAAKNGAALYSAMNCDGCHGGDGGGWVGPSLADGRWRYGGADAEVFTSIYYGRPKGMPAFGGALPSESVWTLVMYLKSLTPPPNVPTESFEQ